MTDETTVFSYTPAFQALIAEIAQLQETYLRKEIGTSRPLDLIKWDLGPSYIRVYIENSQNPSIKSVHCFINRANGDLLKGSWKAPVAKGKRANIFVDGWKDAITAHGPKYLKGT